MSVSDTPEDEILSREKFLNSLAESYLIQDAILSATELSVISFNTDGVINSMNRAAEKILGYAPEELIGKTTPLLFHDSGEIKNRADELTRELGRPIEPGFDALVARVRNRSVTADRCEWTYIHKNGSRIPVVLSISGIWNEHEELTGFLGIAADISQQKSANEELRKSRLHLEKLIASIDDLVVEVARDGLFRNVWTRNDALWPNKEVFAGKRMKEVLPESMIHLFEGAMQEVFANKKSVTIEYQTPVGDQHRSCKMTYVHDDSVLWLVRDISAKRRAEQKMRDSEEKFRLLAENFTGTIYLCRNDATYSMVYVSNNVRELTGHTPDHFYQGSINFVQLYHPEDTNAIFKEVDDALAQKRKFHLNYRIKNKTGEWRWVEEHGIGVYDKSGQLLLIEGYLVDITDRKKSEQDLILSKNNLESATLRLQEQNDQLNEFTNILSHNLRSPVGNISALISLINDQSNIADYQEIFSNLKKTAASLQDTLNELIQTIHINKGALSERVSLRFEDALTKVKVDLAGEILRCNAEITSDFSEAEEVLYSKAYLDSILLNLLSNALKYRASDRKPLIRFKTEKVARGVVLHVTDNGLGIDLEKYGSELFGLRKTFHQHPDSKGVGLFLTRAQIKSMGGDITARSELNVGTTFIVEF